MGEYQSQLSLHWENVEERMENTYGHMLEQDQMFHVLNMILNLIQKVYNHFDICTVQLLYSHRIL